eukprot:TRINITY_DN25026_c0_g1_i1.p1 TRINITY_DN25026_c0_g1~~TRINITY_DN25026_c0_g1_i1.p1  ORF type:complete len:139 (-),score=34.84 TRINITY_DN25026_c0_g1_i1:150-566(-)
MYTTELNHINITNAADLNIAQNNTVTNLLLVQYATLLSYVIGAANNSKCFGELGCLEISERWYDLYRPVNLLPLDREVINTQFMLRTRENRQERKVIISDKKAVQETGFDGTKPTKIIIHGFIDTGFETWVKDMCNAC